ncbi:MAG: hypothetical protein ACTHNM_11770 [Dyella sp.]|uniref:hypothetical protein n=1 Tax=Dyella sp. TaxID=1869338 RepID=UPI003F816F4F
MPGSRALAGIVSGLVETFVSRNNDVSGYWGIGQLRKEIEDQGCHAAELDLLAGQVDQAPPIVSTLIARYGAYLSASLARDGFSPTHVVEAKISIEFGSFGNASEPDLFSTLGEPFNCRATLLSRSGKVFSAVRGGLCRRHDPRCEQQSRRPPLT